MLRSCQGTGHAATLHPLGTYVLAGPFHGAAADRRMFVSVRLVVHTLAVGFEVVDLALHIVAVRTLSVAHLAQVIDHCRAVLAQSGARLLRRVSNCSVPVEELAHLREMIDSVAEIQDVHTVGVLDICHAAPNPLRAIAERHERRRRNTARLS